MTKIVSRQPHKKRKGTFLSTYEALTLMIAFAVLVLMISDKNNKK